MILVCAALLASCDMGTRNLCCGYETSEDWTSGVSIVKDGLVVLAYVSAIVEQENGYVIELREPVENAPTYALQDCKYARIDRQTGARSSSVREGLRTALSKDLSNGEAKLVLATQKSCLTIPPRS